MPSEILSVEGLSKSYGKKQVLRRVTFSIGRGETVGIVGPSGCGKSTLVRIILGLEKKSGGRVTLSGSAGYVPQQDSFYRFLTVRENLEYFAALRKGGRVPDNLFGLNPRQMASELSGGQRKRLSIACSLVDSPAMLLLDEPTAGLDPLSKRDVLQALKDLKKRGTSSVMVTHHMKEAEECDKVLFISDGETRAFGSPAALMRKSKAENLEEVFIRLAAVG